ncbi:hypothetical protein AB0B25_25985 [Nocardia sp. NPDC049190]|uniref:hypothetical protein n=1 Tax=Nocardia sp. NPDC049190 TaxID=3155650 RepID=UPI0033EE1564
MVGLDRKIALVFAHGRRESLLGQLQKPLVESTENTDWCLDQMVFSSIKANSLSVSIEPPVFAGKVGCCLHHGPPFNTINDDPFSSHHDVVVCGVTNSDLRMLHMPVAASSFGHRPSLLQ